MSGMRSPRHTFDIVSILTPFFVLQSDLPQTPSEMLALPLDGPRLRYLMVDMQVIKPEPNVFAANVLGDSVFPHQRSQRRSPSDMVKTRLCDRKTLLDMERVTCHSRVIKFGWKCHLNVSIASHLAVAVYVSSCWDQWLIYLVTFEDETEQTAADYHVVSAGESPVVPKTTRKARFSTSTSTLPSIASPTQAFTSSAGPSRKIPHSRTHSMDSLLPPDTPRDHPKLADFNEAFLLRHFQRTLGPWVLHPFLLLSTAESLTWPL